MLPLRSYILLLLSTLCLSQIKAEPILKKIHLINLEGKRTVVNAAAVLAFQRTGVNRNNNYLTEVLEIDAKGNIVRSLYKAEPPEIITKAMEKGVEYCSSHRGIYYNPELITNSSVFITRCYILFNNALTVTAFNKDPEKWMKNIPPIKGRTGLIVIDNLYYFKVSKRKVPDLKRKYKKNRIKLKPKWWKYFKIVCYLSFKLQLDDDILAKTFNFWNEAEARKTRRQIIETLHREYNEVLYLEGEYPITADQFGALFTAYAHGVIQLNERKPNRAHPDPDPDNSYSITRINELLRNPIPYTPSHEMLSTLKRSLLQTAMHVLLTEIYSGGEKEAEDDFPNHTSETDVKSSNKVVPIFLSILCILLILLLLKSS